MNDLVEWDESKGYWNKPSDSYHLGWFAIWGWCVVWHEFGHTALSVPLYGLYHRQHIEVLPEQWQPVSMRS